MRFINKIKEKMENEKFKKVMPVLLVISLLAMVFGLSYAIWNKTLTSNLNTITSGTVSMSFIESSNVITINNALPMRDNNGKELTNYFDFSVTSNLTLNSSDPSTNVNYDIIIETLSVDSGYTALTDSQIKVYLEDKADNGILVAPTLISSLSNSSSNKLLYSTSHTHSYGINTITTNYRLRVWIDYDVDASSWTSSNKYEYKFRINIEGDADGLSKPQVTSTSLDNLSISANVTSNEEIDYFGFSNNAGTEPTTWIDASSYLTEVNNNNYTLNYTFNDGGTYYLWLKDKSNNIIVYNEYFTIVKKDYASTTIKNDNVIKSLSADFGTEKIGTDTTKSGLYAYTEGSDTDYFFRGYVNNNWVKFGKDSSNNDMYWRIYRITSNDEIRMIYAGVVAPTSSTGYVDTTNTNIIGSSAFNSITNSAEYVGYQYTLGEAHGKSNDSTIKTVLDTWYTNNLTEENSFISTSNYCYDRTTYSGKVAVNTYSGSGVGTTPTWFMGGRRLISVNEWKYGGTGASLVCSNANDVYNLKIGLIGLDELNIAGLKFFSTNYSGNEGSNYLISKNTYWAGTPFYYNNDGTFSAMTTSEGTFRDRSSSTSLGVRPVISLKANTMVVDDTDGTYLHPYEFTLG